MKRSYSIAAALALIFLAQMFAAGTAGAVGKLTGGLEALGPDDEARVIIKLADQLDPDSVTKDVRGRNKGLRTKLLVQALKDYSDKSQKNLLSLLNTASAKGRAKKLRQLWIVNSVALTAPRELLDEIAALPEVLEIYPDEAIPLAEPVLTAGPAEPNLTLIGAPGMWDLGFTGQGVVVANVDSGVDYLHQDLAPSYRGGANSWYDPNGEHATPYDNDGHGTMTMGIMVGGSASGTAIGVAPGAQWIAVKAFDDSGSALDSALHAGYQWLLDPDGNPGTDDAPDIVNNSWGIVGVDVPPGSCVQEFEPDIAALRAAGILPVFSAGNSGELGTSSDLSPANNAGALSVGATDNFDTPQLFSSMGPNSCDESLFPLLSAPGSSIFSSYRTFGVFNQFYASGSGTSFSAPHVSGAAALLLSAFPSFTPDQLQTALINGAYDISPAGPDNTTGYGRVDVLASYFSVEPPAAPVLLAPANGSAFWKLGAPPTFSWQSNSAVSFELQVSRFPDFYKMKVFPYQASGSTSDVLPDYRMWKKIRRQSRRGLPAYWRVKGIAPDGSELVSETRTFTVYKELPLP